MTLTGSGADAPARVGYRLRGLHSQGRLRRSGSGTKSDVLRQRGRAGRRLAIFFRWGVGGSLLRR